MMEDKDAGVSSLSTLERAPGVKKGIGRGLSGPAEEAISRVLISLFETFSSKEVPATIITAHLPANVLSVVNQPVINLSNSNVLSPCISKRCMEMGGL